MTTGQVLDPVDALYAALKHLTPRVRQDHRLPVPPARSVEVSSPECGSRLTLDAIIEQGRVRELGYQVRACSLGQATTAILAQHAPGLTRAELQRVRGQFEALLRTGAGHCDWPELDVFAPASDIPNRHASALLPFKALDRLFQ
ncbi:MAG TPA: hypothetical protein PKA16_10725 [Ottowia sp.]|uniref:iron-sulfur cluster assembly scaffold protein n=1 Tax=Ottowia sp. TaxID=1898956 RepID=UPI002B7E974C|nr:hypothetical protein [Ottowia sp.]HMN21851.1 hypothetical protein [Ottowia sp.]